MEGHGGRRWWAPAHSWGERRDEALALRSSRYSWRLPILAALVLLLLGTTFVRGVARVDPVAIVVPLLLVAALVMAVAKALDARIEGRAGAAAVVESTALLELRGLHGLERLDPADVPPWLADVRALRERADGTPVRVAAALGRERELVVALVTGCGARELLVVRRLPVDVGGFTVQPRRHAETRVGAGVEDLFEVAPAPDALPGPIVAWLVSERPHLRLEVDRTWLVLRPASDRLPADDDALVAAAERLLATADHLAADLGPDRPGAPTATA